MVKRILNHKSKTIFSAAVVLGVAALTSRVLGLIRDRLLAGRFGAGDELDIYFAAFRLPDLIYSILIMGAISSAFIPIFAQYFRKDKEQAWQLTSGLFNLIVLILIILAGVFIILAPWLVSFIAPGFSGVKREMTILLTRIMFLSPLLLGMSSILSGVLQYFHRFFIYSLAPVMYNIGIIIGILFFVPRWGLVGLAWGVVLGAGLHLLIQLPSVLYSGFRLTKVFKFFHPGIKKIIKLMIPRTIGLAGFQINFLVITAIASTLTAGSIAIFNLSHNLYWVPIGIVGVSFATATFPRLAKSFIGKKGEQFSANFSSAFSQILYLVLPITVLFFLLRAQIVRIILGTGEFGWVDTRLTAAALGIFAFSIFAQSLIPLISKAFYAFQNTKTPVLISLLSIGLNVLGSFFFVWTFSNVNWFSSFVFRVLKLQGINNFAVLGLPIAFVLAGIFNFIILLKFFDKKIKHWHPQQILNSLFKIIIACILMAITVYALLYVLDLVFNTRTFIGIFLQAAIAAFGGTIIYFISTLLLKSSEGIGLIRKIIKK
jgi:putative peptidoglycan lipid II flippase